MKTPEKDIRYKRTPKGVLTQIYCDQKKRSKLKGFPLPSYTLKEFHNIFLNNSKFLELHIQWVKNGFQKLDKPSFDRIDPLKPYSMDNIQVMTWRENREKENKELYKIKGTPIIQFDKNGQEINRFSALHEAARKTGCDARLIHKCCNGERKFHGSFMWSYV